MPTVFARAHDPEELPGHDLRPRREHRAEHRADALEALVLERQLLRVGRTHSTS